MGNVTVMKDVQYGLEGTHGTAVAADTQLYAQVDLPSTDRKVVLPGIGTGRRVPHTSGSAYIQRIAAEGIKLSTPDGAYFQILPLLLSACVKGNITPSETTPGQSDYAWSFTDNLTGTEDLETFTLECGYAAANEGYEIPYCLVRQLVLSGNAETGEVTLDATIDGAQIDPTTLTTIATPPSFTPIIGKLTRLYANATWATLGNTELTEALLDWKITIDGGAHLKRRGGATLYAASHGQGAIKITVDLGLERSSAVVTESLYHYDSGTITPRFLRLSNTSLTQIGSGGYHKFQLDICGIPTVWSLMNRDQDGNALDAVTFEAVYDATGTHAFDIDVTTNVSAI